LRGNALVANDMESEKELSQPPREQPVNSIENDGAITRETWKLMMDVVMAIYDYREEEYV
jgi:chromatin structure-remodeling complex subunit RSC1/2